jgi:uncharacterized membrane protein
MAERRPRLDQPNLPRRGVRVNYDPEAFGRLTESIARFLGTGRYLVIQTSIVVVWIGWNLLFRSKPFQFDHFPYILLTLALSLQAAYSAPLILLAQNRQDDRDRLNMDEDRSQARRISADAEYLAREIAAVRIALGDVVTRDFMRSELNRLDRQDEEKSEGGKGEGKSKSGKRKAHKEDATREPATEAAPAIAAVGRHEATADPVPTAPAEINANLDVPGHTDQSGESE